MNVDPVWEKCNRFIAYHGMIASPDPTSRQVPAAGRGIFPQAVHACMLIP
jgi:hypothetical protein